MEAERYSCCFAVTAPGTTCLVGGVLTILQRDARQLVSR